MCDLSVLESQIQEMNLLLVDDDEAIKKFIKKFMYPSDRRALGAVDDQIVKEFRREIEALKKTLTNFNIKNVYELRRGNGFALDYDGLSKDGDIAFVWNKAKQQYYFRGVMARKLSAYGVNFFL